jgi:hypothetical protein
MNRVFTCCVLAALFPFDNSVYAAQYRFASIVDNTTEAPKGTFDSFGLPSISGETVAVRGNYTDPETLDGQSGIFTGAGQSLQTIVKTGDSAPSGVFRDTFSDPTISGPLVAFRGVYAGTTGIFIGSGGSLSSVAQPGDLAPPGILSNEFGDPAISDGTVAVRSGYTNDKKGIVSASGGPHASIVATGDPAPVGTFGFMHFGHPAVSDENVVFRAGYPGGSAIFVGSGGPLSTVVRFGDAAPVGTFSDFGAPSIDGHVVAFSASYTGGAGIFTSAGGTLSAVVKLGDTAPVGTFTGVGTPSVSGNEVAFLGSYGGISPRGIFIGGGGSITSVITTGNMLFGSSVVDLGFSRFGFDPDSTGRVAFTYLLADGRTGVAVAMPVPEPCTIALSWFGAILLGSRRACVRRSDSKLYAGLPCLVRQRNKGEKKGDGSNICNPDDHAKLSVTADHC